MILSGGYVARCDCVEIKPRIQGSTEYVVKVMNHA